MIVNACGLRSAPALLFGAHYLGNLCWAPLFFKFRKFRAAAFLNVGLVGSLAAVMGLSWPAAPLATAVLTPYAAWLAFATKLNFDIAALNPPEPGTSGASEKGGKAMKSGKAA